MSNGLIVELKEALRVLEATKLDAEKNGFKYGNQAVVVKTIKRLHKVCYPKCERCGK